MLRTDRRRSGRTTLRAAEAALAVPRRAGAVTGLLGLAIATLLAVSGATLRRAVAALLAVTLRWLAVALARVLRVLLTALLVGLPSVVVLVAWLALSRAGTVGRVVSHRWYSWFCGVHAVAGCRPRWPGG